MRLIFTAALLALATPAAAAQWYMVGGNDGMRTYVDLSSLRTLDNKIIGEVLSIYAEPMDDSDIYGAKIREEFDCSGKSFRTLEYSYYRADGGFIETQPSETINQRKTSAPGSINEAIMDFACYRKGGNLIGEPFQHAASELGR
ncbi:surface-adhesin E family protein [Sphingopyxis sp.]|uniref:surface-adhesin E family protein n=1 Tax=Sphingopyxis sp. TaxID=1908224 RepID=UPI003D11750D